MSDLPKASEHTPGPWEGGRASKASNFGNWCVRITARDERGLASVARAYGGNFDHSANAEANARRIVACVNACEGMSLESLEGGTQPGLANAKIRGDLIAIERDQLREQNKELREILSEAIAPGDPYARGRADVRARAVLAKFK